MARMSVRSTKAMKITSRRRHRKVSIEVVENLSMIRRRKQEAEMMFEMKTVRFQSIRRAHVEANVC